MTPIVWVNVLLAAVFVAAFSGVPLWLTLRRRDQAPDHAAARAYLARKTIGNAILATRPGSPARPAGAPTAGRPAGPGPRPAARPAAWRPVAARS